MFSFDIDAYKGKYAMLVENEEEFAQFSEFLHNCGRTYQSGLKYMPPIYSYFRLRKTSVMRFNDGMYSSYETAKRDGFEVLKFSDFVGGDFYDNEDVDIEGLFDEVFDE